ncbi:diguanylate cyclase domain-containing protein [Novosphingobium sp. Leaf2]|uniref:diguanylate cyclase domain-containing protein n=1 Tax=Novosphingobium sp. Leaf2 TaxID=1735670 RepID=UPI000701E899|nr:diguanylate cyclase [Novosphingobium sp. Leaf2]KQM20591.1 hypothetical protein ASE49_16460 [Novosphingobium sp. Leaf2]
MANLSRPEHVRESERVEKLKAFGILDTPPEPEFDTIVALAQRLLDVPIALVSLVDDHRQWFKAKCGLSVSETEREHAFCSHAIDLNDAMIVEDATRDSRFVDNPLVTGEPGIRFYAGVPLRPAADGFAEDLPGIGTLCVIDTKPRSFSEREIRSLKDLANLVSALIGARAAEAAAVGLSRSARTHVAMLERQHLQLRQAERMAGIGSWRLDLNDQRLYWSEQVYVIHGLPHGQMPSLDEALKFYRADDRAEIDRLLKRCATHGEPFDFESDFFTVDGRERRVRSMGEAQVVDGRVVAIIGVFQDVTERHAREQSLRRDADTDALTGLANRSCLNKHLNDALERARAANDPACLLLLDLDGFKGVNDTFGHATGDDVLRGMAQTLRGVVPPKSVVARLGGDEFVVLLTRPRDCGDVETVVGAVLASLRDNVEKDGIRRTVSVTVGAALLDSVTSSSSEWLHRADVALYEAKRVQRGTGRLYGSDIVVCPTEQGRLKAAG